MVLRDKVGSEESMDEYHLTLRAVHEFSFRIIEHCGP
jgi:hypothetical protein